MAAFKETTLRPKIINICNNIISIIPSSLLKSHKFKRSNFAWYFYMVMTQIIVFLQPAKPKNPAPVRNPDQGSHYLKKSPSPTGTKDPPTLTTGHNGTTINTADEYLQRKAMLTCGQQVNFETYIIKYVSGIEWYIDVSFLC